MGNDGTETRFIMILEDDVFGIENAKLEPRGRAFDLESTKFCFSES